jgi:hypothetical protein
MIFQDEFITFCPNHSTPCRLSVTAYSPYSVSEGHSGINAYCLQWQSFLYKPNVCQHRKRDEGELTGMWTSSRAKWTFCGPQCHGCSSDNAVSSSVYNPICPKLINGFPVTQRSVRKFGGVTNILSRSMESDSRRGFWLDIGFTCHFKTQLVITLNYSTIAISTLYRSLEHTLSLFQSAVSSLVFAW